MFAKLSTDGVVVLPEKVGEQRKIRGVHAHGCVQVGMGLGALTTRVLYAVRDYGHLHRNHIAINYLVSSKIYLFIRLLPSSFKNDFIANAIHFYRAHEYP